MRRNLALPFLFVMTAALSAADIQVPDLETRITNTGNAIPESALPAVKIPAPSALPAAVPVPETVPPAADAFAVPEMDPAAAGGEAADGTGSEAESWDQPAVTGWLDLGAGGPLSLFGDVSLFRESGTAPGFSADFRYDSADGYGAEKAGTGYFDRSTRLSARVFGDGNDASWTASFGLTDRTDGFQGKSQANADSSFGLSRRDISWNSELRSDLYSVKGLSGSVGFAGSAFSAAAAPLDGYDGYFMTPRAALQFESGAFSAEAHGFYGYETAAGEGEFHSGTFGLDLRYASGPVSMEAGAAALGDSSDGLIVPFRLGLRFDANESFLRSLYASGGLVADRNSSRLLAAAEPFAAPGGLSVYAADWTAAGGLTVAPADAVSVGAGAEYRTSAFGRGSIVLLDERDPSGYVPAVREERDSLVTKVSASLKGSGSELSAAYSGEWLDRLYRKSVHSLDAGFRVFDTADRRLWEAGIDSVFFLDGAELPRLGLKGTVSPAANFALTLSFADALPLVFGTERTRNGMYAERSGELIFSARLDF